jgi:hypothetical protein
MMDSHRIVGIGNIYASESLFRAGIDPRTAAGRMSLQRCARCRRHQGHTGRGHRGRRQQPARLHPLGWQFGLFSAAVFRLRPDRRGLPSLRPADPGTAPGPARNVLLRGLPEVGRLLRRQCQELCHQLILVLGMVRVVGNAILPSTGCRRDALRRVRPSVHCGVPMSKSADAHVAIVHSIARQVMGRSFQ